MKKESNCLYLPIEKNASFALTKDGNPWIMTFFEIARDLYYQKKDCSHIKVVLVEQKGSAYFDLAKGPAVHLDGEPLRDDYRRWLGRLRLLVQYIKKSPIPWVYVAHGDCFSFFYELAQSCDCFLILDQNSRTGLPEIQSGLFPIGGWLEEKIRQNPRAADTWLRQPVHDRFLHVDENHDKLLVNWQGANFSEPQLQIKVLEYAANIPKNASALNGKDPLISCYEMWLKNPLNPDFVSGLHERKSNLWDLVRERLKRTEPPQIFAHWFMDIVATYLSSREFTSVIPVNSPMKPNEFFQSNELESVIIDLREMRPPISILERIMTLDRPIMFCDIDELSLRRSLELIYAKLERRNDRILEFWERRVSWFLVPSDFQNAKQPVLSSRLQGTIEWEINQKVIAARLVEELPKQGVYLELNQSDEKWLPWFTFLGAMVSVTPYINTEYSISDWIRSWALEELLKIASPATNGILGLVLELKNSGWRFIGDEIQLEQFVTRRLGSVTADRESFKVGQKCLAPALLDPLPWKLVKKTGIESVQAAEDKVTWWVGSRLSLHFLCLSCLMMAVIREALPTVTLDDESIDQLVSRSLGIPKDWTFSSFFLKIWGIRRVQIYVAQNWPELASAMLSLPNVNPKSST